MKKIMLFAVLTAALFIPAALFAADARVVATTPWTAAFAQAAGAQRVTLLAPYDMQHPPEYELRATDLIRVRNADLVVFAGYEVMMDRLYQAMGESIPSVRITTNMNRDVLRESITAIAEVLGTEDEAEANLQKLYQFMDDWAAELRELGIDQQAVLAHSFHEELMKSLGLEVAGTFGPMPLEAQQILRLSRTDAQFVIDNWHNEVGTPFTETMDEIIYLSFINIPGKDGTRTLLDVLEYNRELMHDALP